MANHVPQGYKGFALNDTDISRKYERWKANDFSCYRRRMASSWLVIEKAGRVKISSRRGPYKVRKAGSQTTTVDGV